VALRAGRGQVRAHQRKSGGAVIEGRGRPSRRGVAVGTVRGRKQRARRRVRGVVGALPGGQVALRVAASCRCDL